MSSDGVTTIAEVARHAGVSRATVSRVMNGRASVDPALAERVRQVATRLNYSPSRVARSLSLGRTQTIGLLVPDLGNPMFQQVLRGANQAARRSGYRILVADSIEEPQREAELAIEARRRCDALILCSPRMPETELISVLQATRPVVLVNRELAASAVPTLTVDYVHGIRAAAQHLLDLGHRRLLYLAGPAQSASNAARVGGLRDFQREHPEAAIEFLACGSMIEDGHRAGRAVLESGASAVLAFNDLVAFGLLGALDEAGADVPGDLSVVGFDDIDFARYARPSLTTMHVPQAELGHRAWEHLHDLLEPGEGSTPPTQYYRPTLIARGSTGAPP
ncbi:LacI family transcriptional regulator [Ruania suaedae]|uniref:LacI family DNA-binding transcriptional regulator n=1 Tax=Ruania suaedae TaxID=2897774 RepID=UPI001E3C7EE5|nr:LacI family DNA-binding transcriptional regulator [Ruania suaedae]UFU02527.1 LacI family transcriptional regulator [Ruania suaedae]